MGTGIINPFLAVATEKGRYNTVTELKADTTLKVDDIVRTIGTNTINDGISTTYIIKADNDLNSDGKNIQLNNGLWGIHIPQQGTDYKILNTGTDLNDIVKPGTYIRNSDSNVIVNSPVNKSGYLTVYSMNNDDNNLLQVYYENAAPIMHTRRKINGTWNQWFVSVLDEKERYKIVPKQIGSTDETIDILDFALNNPQGFYVSQNAQYKFTNLPNGITATAFKMQLTGISEDIVNSKYRTVIIKDINNNRQWVNTNYSYNTSAWIGWKAVVNESDAIISDRGIINTKEEADARFAAYNTTQSMAGYIWVNNFSTCFPNTLVPVPYDLGIVETYYADRYAIQRYTPHAVWRDFTCSVYKRTGVKNIDDNNIVWGDWVIDNNQTFSGKTETSWRWVKFADGTFIQHCYLNVSTYTNGTYMNYPTAFFGAPTGVVSERNNGQTNAVQIFCQPTAFVLFNVEPNRTNHEIYIALFGRWK